MLFVLGVIILGLFGVFNKQSKEEIFWNWFQKNSDRLFVVDENNTEIFKYLTKEINKIDSNLTFEFAPVKDGKREFIISASGIKASFPAVERLYKAQPILEKWIIVKYRPRISQVLALKIGEVNIEPKDVRYLLFKDENPAKAGILLFIQDFKTTKDSLFEQAGYLILDSAIGEYDMETYIGAIDIVGFDSEHYSKSLPIDELAQDFDNWKTSKLLRNFD